MNEANIIEITSEGLTYLNETDEKRFIDFADCYQRYLDRWNDPNNVKRFKEGNPSCSDEELEASLETIRSLKEVGWRRFSVPCVEFYTEPPIRFDFSNRAEFDNVVGPIRKLGWKTFDMD